VRLSGIANAGFSASEKPHQLNEIRPSRSHETLSAFIDINRGFDSLMAVGSMVKTRKRNMPECPKCKKISKDARRCPHCGASIVVGTGTLQKNDSEIRESVGGISQASMGQRPLHPAWMNLPVLIAAIAAVIAAGLVSYHFFFAKYRGEFELVDSVTPSLGYISAATATKQGVVYLRHEGRKYREIWLANVGTLARQRIDIRGQFQVMEDARLCELNGSIYFTASDHGRLIDGKLGGNLYCVEIATGNVVLIKEWVSSRLLTAVNNRVIFFVNGSDHDENGRHDLWVTDGTEAGTVALMAGHEDLYCSDFYANNGGDVLLEVRKSVSGTIVHREIWRTDGTPQGTTKVLSCEGALQKLQAPHMAVVNGTTIFSVDVEGLGGELWATRGGVEEAVLLHDINPGKAGSGPYDLQSIGDALYFSARGSEREELWKTDGTPGGTRLVCSMPSKGAVLWLAPHDRRLNFLLLRDYKVIELWGMKDGDAAIALEKVLWTGHDSGNVSNLVRLEGSYSSVSPPISMPTICGAKSSRISM
jgi:ELWxxDGT repeat protein